MIIIRTQWQSVNLRKRLWQFSLGCQPVELIYAFSQSWSSLCDAADVKVVTVRISVPFLPKLWACNEPLVWHSLRQLLINRLLFRGIHLLRTRLKKKYVSSWRNTKMENRGCVLTSPFTESSWSPRLSPPLRSATPPGIIREMYIGELCSRPPMTLNPKPSSVFGNSITRGCAWPSLAAKAATVAWKYEFISDGGLQQHITKQCLTFAVALAATSWLPEISTVSYTCSYTSRTAWRNSLWRTAFKASNLSVGTCPWLCEGDFSQITN